VTGFGLLGHMAEMVCGSGMSVRVFSRQVPLLTEALELASMGLIPAGAYKNREFRESMIDFAKTVERSRQDILVDPQTSGGLLIAVEGYQGDELVAALIDAGIHDAAHIGEIHKGPEEKIWVV
jgi:selenide,water dikinase